MIVSPTTSTTSGQRYHHFVPSSFINNVTASLQPVIASLRMRQKSICKWCGSIGHKAGACIIQDPKFLPPILRRKMNQFNALHGEEPNEPPRVWNSQPPAADFKSITSPPKTSPMFSAIMGILNNHAIDNVDAGVHPSEFPVEFNS